MQVRGDTDNVARIEIHPKIGPLVRAAFERYGSGWHSLKSLAVSLSREGLSAANGRLLAPAQVQRMLTNPFYTGRVHWQDLQVAGNHEPLVTPALFNQVQKMLSKRSREPGAKGSVRGFPLRGLAICAACRGHMTAGWHKRRWGYYRCARRSYNKALCTARGYCPSKTVASDTEEISRKLSLPAPATDAIRSAALQLIHDRSAGSDRRLNSLRMQRQPASLPIAKCD